MRQALLCFDLKRVVVALTDGGLGISDALELRIGAQGLGYCSLETGIGIPDTENGGVTCVVNLLEKLISHRESAQVILVQVDEIAREKPSAMVAHISGLHTQVWSDLPLESDVPCIDPREFAAFRPEDLDRLVVQQCRVKDRRQNIDRRESIVQIGTAIEWPD